ncbi:MAG TPA: hypothetical protein VMJ35_11850 [Dongiaceae bacterium]|nr:hypothetical protein [Dongiaceae bacterium]
MSSDTTPDGLRKICRSTDLDDVEQGYAVSTFLFVNIELDLAITFAEVATSANSRERKERNIQHAMQAHRAVNKFMNDKTFTSEMMRVIAEKLERLSLLFAQL